MTDFLSFPEVVGQRKLMTRLLTHRFGELSPEVQAHLAELSPEQLAALAREIFAMERLADLQVWLERNPPAGWENPIPEEYFDDDDDEDADAAADSAGS